MSKLKISGQNTRGKVEWIRATKLWIEGKPEGRATPEEKTWVLWAKNRLFELTTPQINTDSLL